MVPLEIPRENESENVVGMVNFRLLIDVTLPLVGFEDIVWTVELG